MISNTAERLFIVYNNIFLQKKVFFPHVRNFTLIYGPFNCLINVFFGPILLEKIVIFLKARSILELMLCNQNLDILTLLGSDCMSMSCRIDQVFEKIIKYVFIFILLTPTLTYFFLHFLINLFFQICHICNLH